MPKPELTHCPICHSERRMRLSEYKKHGLVKCSRCGFVFCKKNPTPEELQDYYSQYPRSNVISAITGKRYFDLLDKMEMYRSTNRIIDVGCGDGYFLEVARRRGWDVYGTEFTQEAIGICEEKGIKMFKSPLQPADFEDSFFDIITSFEVFEHINTPRTELRSFRKILRTGGLVYMTTPNFNSLSRYLLGARWNVIAYPEHLCYYTRRTLIKSFVESDFKLITSATTGISIDRIKRSACAASSEPVCNYDELIRTNLEHNLFLKYLKSMVNFILSLFGKGDTLKMFFIKQ